MLYSLLRRFRKTPIPTPATADSLSSDEIRLEAQNVLIAFAEVYTKHMTPEQIAQARVEFRMRVEEMGWQKWFSSPLPQSRAVRPGPLLQRDHL